MLMITHSSTFESPKFYLFRKYLKNSIPVFVRYVISAKSAPLWLHSILCWLAEVDTERFIFNSTKRLERLES